MCLESDYLWTLDNFMEPRMRLVMGLNHGRMNKGYSMLKFKFFLNCSSILNISGKWLNGTSQYDYL